MELRLRLALPHDATSVPVVRRMLASAMKVLGVDREVIADIELALTEACANVLKHAGATDAYEVVAGIDGNRCVLEVIDHGKGFDVDSAGRFDVDHSAEGGRGIQLMRALVDQVTFTNHECDGTVVRLEKTLTWDTDAAVRQLMDGSGPVGAVSETA